jgi:ABC-type transporter MlaC component
VCSGCGEDGCCNATKCKMSPDGSYCETYLKDLKVAYYMYDWFMENVYDTLTEEQKEKSDEAYEQILDKVYGEN